MNSFLKNYGATLALLAGVLIGGACGAAFGESVKVVKPIGDIFLNFMFVLVVPLVFFSIASSIYNMKKSGMLGKVFLIVVLVFMAMSLIASIITYFGTLIYNPLSPAEKDAVIGSLPPYDPSAVTSFGDAVVNSLSVPDFANLLVKANLLPMIVFAVVFGVAVCSVGEKGEPVARFLNVGTEIIGKMLNYVMFLAPVGLGCYFAWTIAEVGSQLLSGYLRSFILYSIISLFFFFVVNSVYVIISGGPKQLEAYWKHIIPPSLTAMATCSSLVAMPGNIEAAKHMGVRPAIAESVVPLGTNIHKDGSVIGNVIKVVFLMTLFGQSVTGPADAVVIVGVSFIAAIVVGAVTGGAMTGEIIICSLLAFPPEMVGVILIISTIIDFPATMVNSSSNVVATLLVDKFTKE